MARGKPDAGERLYCAIRDQFADQDVSPTMLGLALLDALDSRTAWPKTPDVVRDFLAAVEKQLAL